MLPLGATVNARIGPSSPLVASLLCVAVGDVMRGVTLREGDCRSGSRSWVQAISRDPSVAMRDDFYPTPPCATRALISVEAFAGDIWEPACGDGRLSRVLEEAGYRVRSSDLVDYGYGQSHVDFLMEKEQAANIVTNPPYKLMREFTDHALSLATDKVVMLGRLAFLEGKSRKPWFENTPLARVWVFAGRFPMTRGGEEWRSGQSSMIAFAWYVWQHGHEGPPHLGWIEPMHDEPVARKRVNRDPGPLFG